MENVQIDIPMRRKSGTPRKPDNEVSPDALRMRRYQERKTLEAKLPAIAAAAAMAAAGVLAPKADSPFNAELRELAQRSSAETSRLLMTEGPAVVSSCIEQAKAGNMSAAALLLRFCIPDKTTVVLPNARGQTIEAVADSIIQAATAGEMPVQDASLTLKLLQQHSDITLSASLTQRLSALNEQLQIARSTGLIDAQAALQRVPLMAIEEVL
jgi:hypothetical protein